MGCPAYSRHTFNGAAVAIFIVVLVSFIRRQVALWIVACAIWIIPLVVLVGMDVLVFARANSLFTMTFFTMVYMLVPTAFIWAIITDARIRNYYAPNK